MKSIKPEGKHALSITKAASKQTYYTIRFLADRELAADAYRAYAYFRWLDDTLDSNTLTPPERSAFLHRQAAILDRCIGGAPVGDVNLNERMLIDLIRHEPDTDSGLHSYLRNMMAVMAFDTERRGRVITQSELNEYTRSLAWAVTEAMHYFIGHCCYAPHSEARYAAVTAAHITHMLRDTYDDIQAGYFNIPGEALDAGQITPQDVESEAYRTWVRSRVELARAHFDTGRAYLHQVENLRCRLAGFAYLGRFEWLLDTIEREGYCLRRRYDERHSLSAGLQRSLEALAASVNRQGAGIQAQSTPAHER